MKLSLLTLALSESIGVLAEQEESGPGLSNSYEYEYYYDDMGERKKKKKGNKGNKGGGNCGDFSSVTTCSGCVAAANSGKCAKKNCGRFGYHKKRGCDNSSGGGSSGGGSSGGGSSGGGTSTCTSPSTCCDCLSMTKSCRKKSHKNRCKALGYKKKKCSTSCDATTTMATTTTQAPEIAGPSTRGNTYVMTCSENTNDTAASGATATCDDASQKCTLVFGDGTTIIGSMNGDGSVNFDQLPYALPPSRFSAPTMREDFCGDTIDLTQNVVNQCMTNGAPANGVPESEDCLTVQITANQAALTGGAKVPVVYYIHGGGFAAGNNQGNFRTLVGSKSMMVVSISYRLGVFGFLPLDSAEARTTTNRGNWGILDQQAALQWGNKFVSSFGGDPLLSTVVGSSAGGESALYHSVIPGSHSLFTNVVSIGAGMNSALPSTEAQALYTDTKTESGCSGTTAAVLTCLRDLTSAEMIEVAAKVSADNSGFKGGKVIIDAKFGPWTDGSLIKGQLMDTYAAGTDITSGKVVIQLAKDESWNMYTGAWEEAQNVNVLADQKAAIAAEMTELGLKVPNPYYDEWLDVIFQAAPVNNDYFGMLSSFGCTLNGSGRECRDAFTKFLDASYFMCPAAVGFSDVTSQAGLFMVRSDIPNCEDDDGAMTKACHTAEQAYVFCNDVSSTGKTAMCDEYTQFFTDGTFPNFADSVTTKLNTLDDSGTFGSVDVFEANDGNNPYRCDLLDALDNWEFDDCTFGCHDNSTNIFA